MKKISIIVAGLALVAASCTKIETVENGNGNVAGGISFSAYASRLSKAAQEDVTTANLSRLLPSVTVPFTSMM